VIDPPVALSRPKINRAAVVLPLPDSPHDSKSGSLFDCK